MARLTHTATASKPSRMNDRASRAVGRCQSGKTASRPCSARCRSRYSRRSSRKMSPNATRRTPGGMLALELPPHRAFVDIVGRVGRNHDLGQRDAERCGLGAHERAPHAVHADAVVGVGHGGDQRLDAVPAEPFQGLQGQHAVLAPAEAHRDRLSHEWWLFPRSGGGPGPGVEVRSPWTNPLESPIAAGGHAAGLKPAAWAACPPVGFVHGPSPRGAGASGGP